MNVTLPINVTMADVTTTAMATIGPSCKFFQVQVLVINN